VFQSSEAAALNHLWLATLREGRGRAHYSLDHVPMATSPLSSPRRVSYVSLLQELQVRSRSAIHDFCRHDFGCLVWGYVSVGSLALGFREVICSRGGSLQGTYAVCVFAENVCLVSIAVCESWGTGTVFCSSPC
jgi:hypothetical protein